jgi:hypothetical protein
MAEIRAALAVGKEVVTHTAAVSVPGWTGAGYVILDPQTGVGAWKIGGGNNGGWLLGLGAGAAVGILLLAISLMAISGGLSLMAAIFLGLMTLAVYLVAAASLYLAYEKADDEWRACFWGGFGVGLSLAGKSIAGVVAEMLFWIGVSMAVAIPSNAAVQCW